MISINIVMLSVRLFALYDLRNMTIIMFFI
jgi:hypothetical protein